MPEALYLCRTCGIVRGDDRPPWCRHYAIDMPATRMVPIPPHHPLVNADPKNHKDRL